MSSDSVCNQCFAHRDGSRGVLDMNRLPAHQRQAINDHQRNVSDINVCCGQIWRNCMCEPQLDTYFLKAFHHAPDLYRADTSCSACFHYCELSCPGLREMLFRSVNDVPPINKITPCPRFIADYSDRL